MIACGLNGPPDGRFSGGVYAHAHAAWARTPAWPDQDIGAWLGDCRARGIKTLIVFDRSSIGSDPAQWERLITGWRDRYGRHVTAWELGNEPDHASDSSSTMPPAQFAHLLKIGRRVLGPQALLVAGGMVSGNPDWLTNVDLSPVDALGIHPYGKSPEFDWPHRGWGTGYLGDLIIGYRRFNKPLWCTEIGLAIGSGITEDFQAEYLTRMLKALDSWDVEQVCWFALHDDVKGFGLLRGDNSERPSLSAFRRFAMPLPQPAPPQPGQWTAGPGGEWIGSGLLAELNRRRWTPLGGEEPFADGWPAVSCREGLIAWDSRRNEPRAVKWEAA